MIAMHSDVICVNDKRSVSNVIAIRLSVKLFERYGRSWDFLAHFKWYHLISKNTHTNTIIAKYFAKSCQTLQSMLSPC